MPDKIIRLAILADVNKARGQLDDISARLKAMSDKPTTIKLQMAQIPDSDLRAAEAEGQKTGNKFTSGLKSVIDKVGPIAAGALVAGLAFAVKEGIELQNAQSQLANAVKDTGSRYSAFAGQVQATQDRMAKFGDTGTQVDQSLTVLTRSTGSLKLAMSLETTAANLAAAKHIDLSSATSMLAKAAGGAARGMKDLGITQVTGATQAKAMTAAQLTLNDQVRSAGSLATFAAQHHMTEAHAIQVVSAAMGQSATATSDLAKRGLTLAAATLLVTNAQAGDSTAIKTLRTDHLSLAQAESLVQGATSGSTKAFNELGIEVLPKTATAAQRMAQIQAVLNERIGGAASSAAQTFSGQLAAMKAHFTDVAEEVGMKVMPYLTDLLGIVGKIVNNKVALVAVTIAIGAMAAAWIVVQIQAGLAFIAENLALIGIPILIALVVAALAWMITHWKTLRKWLDDFMSWLDSAWHATWHYATAVVDTAVQAVRDSMAWLWNHITQVYSWILHGAADAFGWVPGLGGKLREAAAKFDAFRDSVNNSLKGINNRTVNVEVGFSANAVGSTNNPIGEKKAAGGPVYGPGTSTSDSIPTWLSNKEYVVQASAHEHYGTGFLNAINAKRLAGGGPAGLSVGASFPSQQSVTNMLLAKLIQVVQSGVQLAASQQTFGDSGARSGSAAVAQAYARSVLGRFGWSQSQFPALQALWNQESGWNAYALNASSGAYGIPQSLGHGHPYNMGDYVSQILWGLSYIRQRYGSPSAAEGHEMAYHWYDKGGILKPGYTLAYNGTGQNETVVPNGSSTGNIYITVQGDTDPDGAALRIHQKLRAYKKRKGNIALGLD